MDHTKQAAGHTWPSATFGGEHSRVGRGTESGEISISRVSLKYWLQWELRDQVLRQWQFL